MTKLFREPLLHFLVLGGVFFVLFDLVGRNDEAERADPGAEGTTDTRVLSKEIVVSKGRVKSLAAQFEKVWRRSATQQELIGLINGYVRDEVMYRQALELGLDRDDAAVRRRMRQKLEFITDDIAALAEPTDKDLADYLESHPDGFRLDATFTFKQVYLSTEKRGESLDADIASLLATLRAAGDSADVTELGDSLMLEQVFTATPQHVVARLFGKDFAQGLLEVPVGKWEGPVRSGFGVHLVLISERVDGRVPSLEEVRSEVEREWVRAKREESNEALYQAWLAQYNVTIDGVSGEKEESSQ